MALKNQIKPFFLRTFLPSCLIAFIVVFACSNFSCTSRVPSLSLLDGDFTVPSLEGIKQVSPARIELSFNKEVILTSVALSGEEEKQAINVLDEENEFSCIHHVILEKGTELGSHYVLEGIVTDERKNTLTFEASFNGFNDHPAKAILSEIRNAYNGKAMKSEFVELYVLEDGNLYGLSLIDGYDGTDKKYDFDSIEVRKGQYITVHYRKIKNEDGSYAEEGMADETEDSLALSTATDSCDTALDLWLENNSAVLAPSDVLMLYDSNTDTVMDALEWVTTEKPGFSDRCSSVLEKVSKSGIWKGDAMNSDGMTTVNRSLSRQNVEGIIYDEDYSASAAEWIVACIKDRSKSSTLVQGATPGKTNSRVAYTKD